MVRPSSTSPLTTAPFHPTISETSRCLAAELSPIAERQAEEQARRFARLEALRDDVAKARQRQETFSPTTNKRVRRGDSQRRATSPRSSSNATTATAAVFASTPPSAAACTSSSTVRNDAAAAIAEDLTEEEVRGLWEAFAEPCARAASEGEALGLTAAGARRLLNALGLLSSASHTALASSSEPTPRSQSVICRKFLSALGLTPPTTPTNGDDDEAAERVASFQRFHFVFSRVWRAGASATPVHSLSPPRSPVSPTPRASVPHAAPSLPFPAPNAEPPRPPRRPKKKRVSFQLPNAAIAAPVPVSPPASSSTLTEEEQRTAPDLTSTEVKETEMVVACELSTEEDDEEGAASPEPRNPRAPVDEVPTIQGLSESPASPEDANPLVLDRDEGTPTCLPAGGARLAAHAASPRRASARTPTRPISTSAHVLTPTVSTRQKRQPKRAPYDPMAECTFTPATTPYTPKARVPSVEAATSPTPPPGPTQAPTKAPSMARTAAAPPPPPTKPAGFDKAVQRVQQARSGARAAPTPRRADTTQKTTVHRPSMFARDAGASPVVVDFYNDENANDTAAPDDDVRLYVDVDLPKGGTVRVPVYADDTPTALAAEFAQTYQLDLVHQRRLEVMLASLPSL